MNSILPGMSGSHHTVVEHGDTATALGSGSVPVLATPRLVAWLEAAAVAALDDVLAERFTSVGTHIDLHHLAATAVGRPVDASATVSSVTDRTVTFTLEASDDRKIIGSGSHVRVVVDEERFLSSL